MPLIDNRLSIVKTPKDTLHELSLRFKTRRLAMNLTQEGLAKRASVSWSSLKRFESIGLIALDSLLQLAMVLDCLDDFDQVCAGDRSLASKSLDEILTAPMARKKGRIK